MSSCGVVTLFITVVLSIFRCDAQDILQPSSNTNNDETPNIIFIICDDIGYADVSYSGAEFSTPNIDNVLNNEAIILSRHYVGVSACSPSRSMILTGRYAFNMGIGDIAPFSYASIETLPVGVPTIANLLGKYKSYSTYALGKWHIGYSTIESWPLSRGFDKFHGFVGGAIYYTNKTATLPDYHKYYMDWWNDYDADFSGQLGFSTDQTRADMKEIINAHGSDSLSSSSPFFIWAGLQAPHRPLQSVSKYSDDCSLINNIERQKYCENILDIDNLVSEINIELKKNNLYDNTLIIFTSDNGGSYNYGACNYPLRGAKGTFFEGGINTLTFLYGGYIKNNAQYTTINTNTNTITNIHSNTITNNLRNGLFMGVDWTPTLLSIANINLKNDLNSFEYNGINGINLKDYILYGDEYNYRSDAPLNIGDTVDSGIIFKYDNTLYKLIQMVTEGRVSPEWCYYGWNTSTNSYQRQLYYDYNDTSVLTEYLYDLTNDPREFTNLLDTSNTNKLGYTVNEITEIYDIALSKISTYQDGEYFQEYLSCLEASLATEADPVRFNGTFDAFLDWDQFVNAFNLYCGDDVSDTVKKLFVTKYEKNVDTGILSNWLFKTLSNSNSLSLWF